MIRINGAVRGGANLLPVASEKLSDLMTGQGCPGSQSHPEMKAGRLGGADGEDENENVDETGYEEEAVVAGAAAVESVETGKWSGHVSEKNAKQEVEQD